MKTKVLSAISPNGVERAATVRQTLLHRITFDRIAPFVALIPALLLFIAFTIYPLFASLVYSFTNWNGYSKIFQFVGWANFVSVFQDPINRLAFNNTLYIAILSLVITIPIQLLLAVLLSGQVRGKNIIKALLFIPALLSPVIVELTWVDLLQYRGVINSFFLTHGLSMFSVDWLGDVRFVKLSIILVNFWQYIGIGTIVYMAGIASIPDNILEAAQLDGASGWRKFRQVILPLIMPAVTVNLFLGLTGLLKIFELPFLLTRGGPLNASTTVILNIYNAAFQYENFGLAGSIGIVFFVVIAAISLTQLYITRKLEVVY